MDDRLEVLRNTECAVIQEITSGDWYIALTTSGMDLSHEIVHAYQIVGNYAPPYILDGFHPNDLKHVIYGGKVEAIRQHVIDSAMHYKNITIAVLNECITKTDPNNRLIADPTFFYFLFPAHNGSYEPGTQKQERNYVF